MFNAKSFIWSYIQLWIHAYLSLTDAGRCICAALKKMSELLLVILKSVSSCAAACLLYVFLETTETAGTGE